MFGKQDVLVGHFKRIWRLDNTNVFVQPIDNQFNFLVDGKAKQEILDFIAQNPKFEEICQELQKYNQYVERTQEISSLEYFAFLR